MAGVTGRAAAALALLGLVAFASTSRFDSGGRLVSSPAGYMLVAGAGLVVIGALLLAAWVGGQAAFAGTTARGKASLLGIAITVLAGLTTILLLPRGEPGMGLIPGRPRELCIDAVFWWQHYPDRRVDLFAHPERFCWVGGGGRVVDAARGGGGAVPGTLVAIAGGAALAVIVTALIAAVVARRARRRAHEPTADDRAVVQALDDSLDDLRREWDVRRAIIACWARMEQALAGSGRGRRAHETPLEFLRRVLDRVAAEPGQVLTDLFERARFSIEPMGESEKRSAIAALEQLRARVAE